MSVDAILARHGIRGPWVELLATGLANRIYATADVVLRIATDHPEAVPDARTESVAAPVARAAGVLTPRLIAFDDGRELIDRPYTLWDRVHGETLGLADLDAPRRAAVWRQVGRQVAQLHTNVRECPDPQNYLDTPGRELDLAPTVRRLADSGAADRATVAEVERMLDELRPLIVDPGAGVCFVHNDLHEMNVMCSRDGELLAIIDWGDAGWGDPILDFSAVPLELLPSALEGYGAEHAVHMGACPEARFIWDRLHNAMDDAIDDPSNRVPVAEYRRYLDRHA